MFSKTVKSPTDKSTQITHSSITQGPHLHLHSQINMTRIRSTFPSGPADAGAAPLPFPVHSSLQKVPSTISFLLHLLVPHPMSLIPVMLCSFPALPLLDRPWLSHPPPPSLAAFSSLFHHLVLSPATQILVSCLAKAGSTPCLLLSAQVTIPTPTQYLLVSPPPSLPMNNDSLKLLKLHNTQVFLCRIYPQCLTNIPEVNNEQIQSQHSHGRLRPRGKEWRSTDWKRDY